MPQPHPSLSRSAAVAARLAATLMLLAFAVCAPVAVTRAQSGRKAQKASTTTTTTEAKPQGDSESGAKPGAAKNADALVSFVVMEYDDTSYGLDPLARDGVMDSFVRRLGQSRVVSVTSAGKGRRQEARARAKTETAAYVVLFQLEEEGASSGNGSTGRTDSRTLILRTYVYTPKTADLKYADTIYQRPYRQTARIGGVRVPVPTRSIERYPSQHELEQAARDAADRLLSRFSVAPPPDN